MVHLRAMTDAEFPAWAKISFEYFVQEMARSSGQTAEEVRNRVGNGPSGMGPGDLWNVIVVDDVDVGFWWIKCNFEKREAFGFDIWIKENYRGKGIGREVMLRGREILKAQKIDKLRICVFQENNVARALYASLGFQETLFDQNLRQYHLEINLKE